MSYYRKKSGSYNARRNQKSSRPSGQFQSEDPEITKIWNKMKGLKYWAEYDVVEISKENGDAYKLAKKLVEERKPDVSQLRKYYDIAMKGLLIIKRNDKDIEKARAILAMLNPRIRYAYNRKLVTNTLVNFIKYATDDSKFRKDNPKQFYEDYNKFLNFFEALVGYHAYLKR